MVSVHQSTARTPESTPSGAVTFSGSGQFAGASQLCATLLVPRNRDDVFAFFSDPANLEAITPPWLKFEIVTEPPINMGEGVCIDYKLRVHGIPLRWRSRITGWRPPAAFIDEQVRGPYRAWRHQHLFEEHPDGTLVRDIVDYRVTGGRLVEKLFVRRDLQRIFRYRQQRIAELLSGSAHNARHRMREDP